MKKLTIIEIGVVLISSQAKFRDVVKNKRIKKVLNDSVSQYDR